MAAGSIIEQLNIVEQSRSGFISVFKHTMERPFVLERTKEAFNDSVIIAVTLAAHAGHHFRFSSVGPGSRHWYIGCLDRCGE